MEGALKLEPFLIAVILCGGLLFLAGVVILSMRRRRLSKAEGLNDLKATIAAYKANNPHFYRIMEPFLEGKQGADLLKRGDIRAALKLLSAKVPRARSPLEGRGTVLHLADSGSEGKPDPRTQAAMLTILRAVYLDAQLYRLLPPGVNDELDHLLDTLTE